MIIANSQKQLCDFVVFATNYTSAKCEKNFPNHPVRTLHIYIHESSRVLSIAVGSERSRAKSKITERLHLVRDRRGGQQREEGALEEEAPLRSLQFCEDVTRPSTLRPTARFAVHTFLFLFRVPLLFFISPRFDLAPAKLPKHRFHPARNLPPLSSFPFFFF